MKLNDLKSKYFEGTLEKAQYIKDMHQIHQLLFEYAKFIQETDIKSIEISDNSVIMTSRTTGVKIVCDPTDERIAPIEILNFNDYEKTDFEMISKLIKEDMTIFDIGANIGWYTINMSKMYPTVKIFAFEPIPKTFAQLNKNIDINKIPDAFSFNFGFSNVDEKTEFYYYPEGSGNASLSNLSESSNVEKVTCNVQKLDDFVDKNKLHLDFIKCDVEGAELFVFQGGVKTIERDNPIIFTELLRKWSAKFNYHPNDLINFLTDLGYRCFTAKDGKLTEFFTVTEKTVENTFFFLHLEKHRDLIEKFINKNSY